MTTALSGGGGRVGGGGGEDGRVGAVRYQVTDAFLTRRIDIPTIDHNQGSIIENGNYC